MTALAVIAAILLDPIFMVPTVLSAWYARFMTTALLVMLGGAAASSLILSALSLVGGTLVANFLLRAAAGLLIVGLIHTLRHPKNRSDRKA